MVFTSTRSEGKLQAVTLLLIHPSIYLSIHPSIFTSLHLSIYHPTPRGSHKPPSGRRGAVIGTDDSCSRNKQRCRPHRPGRYTTPPCSGSRRYAGEGQHTGDGRRGHDGQHRRRGRGVGSLLCGLLLGPTPLPSMVRNEGVAAVLLVDVRGEAEVAAAFFFARFFLFFLPTSRGGDVTGGTGGGRQHGIKQSTCGREAPSNHQEGSQGARELWLPGCVAWW
jgi:hypothetical protein